MPSVSSVKLSAPSGGGPGGATAVAVTVAVEGAAPASGARPVSFGSRLDAARKASTTTQGQPANSGAQTAAAGSSQAPQPVDAATRRQRKGGGGKRKGSTGKADAVTAEEEVADLVNVPTPPVSAVAEPAQPSGKSGAARQAPVFAQVVGAAEDARTAAAGGAHATTADLAGGTGQESEHVSDAKTAAEVPAAAPTAPAGAGATKLGQNGAALGASAPAGKSLGGVTRVASQPSGDTGSQKAAAGRDAQRSGAGDDGHAVVADVSPSASDAAAKVVAPQTAPVAVDQGQTEATRPTKAVSATDAPTKDDAARSNEAVGDAASDAGAGTGGDVGSRSGGAAAGDDGASSADPRDVAVAQPAGGGSSKAAAAADGSAAAGQASFDAALAQAAGTNVQHAATAPATSAAPAATATPAPAAEQVFAADNHAKIVSAISGQLLPGGGTMHIVLQPAELGSLRVTVQMHEGVVTASFETSNDQATRLLSHSLSDLKAGLETQGVVVGKLQVRQSSTDSGKSGSGSRQGATGEAAGEQDEQARQQKQRQELLKQMWQRVSIGTDDLDLVA